MDTAKETISYEIGYLINSGLKDEEVKSFSENLRNFITDKGGLVLSEGAPQIKTLAYPIKKAAEGEPRQERETSAFFNWIQFLFSPQNLSEIKNYLNKNSKMLRFLVIKSKKEELTKAVITPSKFTSKFKRDYKRDRAQKDEISAPKDAATSAEPTVKEEEIDKKIEEILSEK